MSAYTKTFRFGLLAIVLSFLTACVCVRANAAPPPKGSEDWEIMHDYADWIHDQLTPNGYLCCSVADGRPVEDDIRQNHYWVYITREKFSSWDKPDGWYEVPDELVQDHKNPIGHSILWVLDGNIRCFRPKPLI